MERIEYLEIIDKFKEDNKDEYKQGKIKKVFTEALPHKGKLINWQESIEKEVYFIYKELEGWIEIGKYIKYKIPKLEVKYIENKFTISIGDFKNGKIGGVVGRIHRQDAYKIDEILKIRTGKIKIINIFNKKVNEFNKKCYQYKCLECGNVNEATGYELKDGVGCNTCCKFTKKVVKEINSIWKLRPDLIKYFVNIEDAYTHSIKSNDYVTCVCPDCGHKKRICISNLYTFGFCCNYYGDSISYSEKVIRNLLINKPFVFKTHETFNWSKKVQVDNPKLCGSKEYDFYFELNNEYYIIETHGMQHYERGFEKIKSNKKVRTLEEEVENDIIKKELALSNGIKEANYIVIDCRFSKMEWIKQNVLKSKLSELFDLSNIDWNYIDIKSQKSLLLEVIEYWNNNEIGVRECADKYLLAMTTIRNYLHRGNDMGLLIKIYNGEEERRKNGSKNGKLGGINIKLY